MVPAKVLRGEATVVPEVEVEEGQEVEIREGGTGGAMAVEAARQVVVEGMSEVLHQVVVELPLRLPGLSHRKTTIWRMITTKIQASPPRFVAALTDLETDIIQPVRRPPPQPAPAQRPIASSSRAGATAPMRELSQNNISPQRPNCNCDVPAAERTAGKDNENKGRQFWTCGNERKCDFFQWADAVPNAAPRRDEWNSVVPAKRPSSQQMVRCCSHLIVSFKARMLIVPCASQNPGPSKMARMCGCDLTAVPRTVSKDGPTKGRRFWSCPNSDGARCGFFEWEDADGSGGGGGAGAGAGAGAGGGGGRTGTCYKVTLTGDMAHRCWEVELDTAV